MIDEVSMVPDPLLLDPRISLCRCLRFGHVCVLIKCIRRIRIIYG